MNKTSYANNNEAFSKRTTDCDINSCNCENNSDADDEHIHCINEG